MYMLIKEGFSEKRIFEYRPEGSGEAGQAGKWGQAFRQRGARCKGPECLHASRNNRSKCGLNERRKGKVVGEGVRKVAVGGGAIM